MTYYAERTAPTKDTRQFDEMGHPKYLQNLTRIALPYPFPRGQFYTRTLIAHLGSYGEDDAFLRRTAEQIASSRIRDRLCFEVVQYTANAFTVAKLLQRVLSSFNTLHPLASVNLAAWTAFFEFGITRAGDDLIFPLRSELGGARKSVVLVNCKDPLSSYASGQVQENLSTSTSSRVKLMKSGEDFRTGNIAPSSLVIVSG